MSSILVNKQDGVAWVTINRPEQMNCFQYETLCTLEEEVNSLAADASVHVVCFTGAGDKAFSTGADLKERRTLTEDQVRRNVRTISRVFQRVAELPQVTIAMVNGYAFGGGFELMLACDFRFAAEEATMGLTEVGWGIIPGAGGTQRLPRLIGEAKAKELIFTAKRMEAQEAKQLGIVEHVCKRAQLCEETEAFVERLLQQAPVALKQAKHAIQEGLNSDLRTGLAIEQKAYEVTIPTKDRIEALDAFREKRKPAFKGC
ncbi:enoyl-CoA hydratase-related protein [Bacillus fonticola]|uniref:enoyl-CoA hydratase-related protein n=1 Tax=Bacillus fonticola TaxID=2728853 RepID=UPI00147366C7|nr:enoyl-CoA hydratase-related protein [Bacillus fonticola]